jgi:hypothetical protein
MLERTAGGTLQHLLQARLKMKAKKQDKGAKASYKSPEVRDYGSVRDITLANKALVTQDHPTQPHFS